LADVHPLLPVGHAVTGSAKLETLIWSTFTNNAGMGGKFPSGGGRGAHVVLAVALTDPHMPLTGVDPSGHETTTVSYSFGFGQTGIHSDPEAISTTTEAIN
jgi:hypothetical protein